MSRKPIIAKTIAAVLCIAVLLTLGRISTRSAVAKDPEIKDGIPGTVVKVDVNQGTVTIAEKGSRERTYSITEETVIVGPRGGIVHRRLKNPRFHNGLPITIVADGTTAVELHLGYDRKARETTGATSRSVRSPRPASDNTTPSSTGSTSTGTNDAGTSTAPSNPTPSTTTTRTSRFRGLGESKRATGTEAVKSEEEEDEDNEFPGKIKSVEPGKRVLVITLVNGKDRSFLLAHDVKVTVNNRVSRSGLSDAALKPGIPLTVITESGGRKVKEVRVTTAISRRARKAA
jgi:hypothetical protein